MWYLYLDESGDLGFDFATKKPSEHFTVSILLVKGGEDNLALLKAVKKTIKQKLNPRDKRNRLTKELKGTDTTLDIKTYFYRQVEKLNFSIYCLTLNKRNIDHKLKKDKSRLYDSIAQLVLDKISFNNANIRVELIIDKSKSGSEIKGFNTRIRRQLEAKLASNAPLEIYHCKSEENGGVQAADLFSWGIFRKYEQDDTDWYDIFRSKVTCEGFYSKP